jgi:hypothetical protein
MSGSFTHRQCEPGGMIFGWIEQEYIQFNGENLIMGTSQTVDFY